MTRPPSQAARAPGRWRGVRRALVVAGLVTLGLAVGSAVAGSPAWLEAPWSDEAAASPPSAGYLVPWDYAAGQDSLWGHHETIGEVNPVWFALGPDGRLQSTGGPGPAHRLELPPGSDIALAPTVTNHHDGGWDPDAVGEILGEADARDRHAAEIADLAARYAWDGVDLDYEFLHPDDRERYTAFVETLAARLHADGRRLSVAVHAKASDAGEAHYHRAYDYAALGAAADSLRIMAYDHHSSGSDPGPVAPVAWVDDVLAYATDQVAPERIALGLAAYGYDWSDEQARDLTWREAVALAERHDARVRWDAAGAAAWFTYHDDAGTEHTVWFEDARSADAKSAVAAEHGVHDVFLWRLGGEDPAIWDALGPAAAP